MCAPSRVCIMSAHETHPHSRRILLVEALRRVRLTYIHGRRPPAVEAGACGNTPSLPDRYGLNEPHKPLRRSTRLPRDIDHRTAPS